MSPVKKTAAAAKKTAPPRKAAPSKAATATRAPAKKTTPAKRATAVKKTSAPVKKTTPAKRATAVKKTSAPVKKTTPAKRATAVKKTSAPVKRAAPAKRTTAVKKTRPAKKTSPAKKAPATKKAVSKRTAGVHAGPPPSRRRAGQRPAPGRSRYQLVRAHLPTQTSPYPEGDPGEDGVTAPARAGPLRARYRSRTALNASAAARPIDAPAAAWCRSNRDEKAVSSSGWLSAGPLMCMVERNWL